MNIIDIALISIVGLTSVWVLMLVLSTYYPPWIRSTFNTTLRVGIESLPNASQVLFLSTLGLYEKSDSIKVIRKFNTILGTVLRYTKVIGSMGIYPHGVEADDKGSIILHYTLKVTIPNADIPTKICTAKIRITWYKANVIEGVITHHWSVINVFGGDSFDSEHSWQEKILYDKIPNGVSDFIDFIGKAVQRIAPSAKNFTVSAL